MAKKSGASVGAVELEEKPSRIGLPADISWRSRRESRNDFLRCQFGRRVHETRRMSVRMGSGAVVEHTLPVTLFYLLGYGPTWDAAKEMTMMDYYDYIVINDQVDRAVKKIQSIIQSEHCRKDRLAKYLKEKLESDNHVRTVN